MFLVILLLITALFVFLSFPKGQVLVGSSRFLFFNFFIPQIGEFQTHSISSPSTSDISVFGSTRIISILPNGTGPF